jgi:hypothetical protein
MKINEHDCVVLTADLPGRRLQKGDVGTVIHIHHGGAAYEVEFTTLDGRTLTVTTVEKKKLRPVSCRDVAPRPRVAGSLTAGSFFGFGIHGLQREEGSESVLLPNNYGGSNRPHWAKVSFDAFTRLYRS